ncbi:hypothetical protein Lsai_0338 [Legionella sainthelensi]|uniref:Uncharacterized protein n=1 Tax=Legionella sainthelensi TaxID=28087 RepID=A0A0W0YTU0_9GAMM|nr:hypothetical protein [Legionella sainthelensi]KTD60228.1 hypothetical protein Lsai_0338 [Legionella sainthelensi]
MNQSSAELEQNQKDLTICANLNREVVPNIIKDLHDIQNIDKVFSDDPNYAQLINRFSSLITTDIFEPKSDYIVWYQQTFADALNSFTELVKKLNNNTKSSLIKKMTNKATVTDNNLLLAVGAILEDTYKIQKKINSIIS